MSITRSKNLLAVLLLASAVATVGCSKKDAANDEATPAEDTAPASAKIAEPALAVYSPEAATAAIAAMEKCDNPYSCESIDTLVGFGNEVSKELAALASNTAKTTEARRAALEALTKIKDPAVGLTLFEAGKVEEDFILRKELFTVAGEEGSDATFDAMIAHYISDESKPHRTEVRFGLQKFSGEKLFAWALENYPNDEALEVRFADLVTDAKDGADASRIVELIAKSKDRMARHRLAAAAVNNGDPTQISILIDGLTAENQYDRSDAANFLVRVVDKVPAERKQEVIDAVTAAKAKDAGGLTSRGYDSLLKELKGE